MRRWIDIHQHKTWPSFTWDDEQLHEVLCRIRNLQGHVVGKMEALGFKLREEALLKTPALDVLKSTEIQGGLLQLARADKSNQRFTACCPKLREAAEALLMRSFGKALPCLLLISPLIPVLQFIILLIFTL